MIIIQAEFLRGCYVAADPAATAEPEWPPAPARLYSALVASAYAQGLDPSPLTALELAPEVRFGPALPAPGPTGRQEPRGEQFGQENLS